MPRTARVTTDDPHAYPVPYGNGLATSVHQTFAKLTLGFAESQNNMRRSVQPASHRGEAPANASRGKPMASSLANLATHLRSSSGASLGSTSTSAVSFASRMGAPRELLEGSIPSRDAGSLDAVANLIVELGRLQGEIKMLEAENAQLKSENARVVEERAEALQQAAAAMTLAEQHQATAEAAKTPDHSGLVELLTKEVRQVIEASVEQSRAVAVAAAEHAIGRVRDAGQTGEPLHAIAVDAKHDPTTSELKAALQQAAREKAEALAELEARAKEQLQEAVALAREEAAAQAAADATAHANAALAGAQSAAMALIEAERAQMVLDQLSVLRPVSPVMEEELELPLGELEAMRTELAAAREEAERARSHASASQAAESELRAALNDQLKQAAIRASDADAAAAERQAHTRELEAAIAKASDEKQIAVAEAIVVAVATTADDNAKAITAALAAAKVQADKDRAEAVSAAIAQTRQAEAAAREEAVRAARLEERHQAAAATAQRQAERNSPEPKKGIAWEEVASQPVTEAGADLEAVVVGSRPSDFYPTLRQKQNTAATRMQAIQRGKSSRAMASRSRASAGGSIRVT